MKVILTILIMLTSTVVTAKTTYKISKGKLHKGGRLQISSELLSDEFKVKLDYKIKKRIFVPIPSRKLKGSKNIYLPEIFSSEMGYIELQDNGEMILEKATVKFLDRIDYGRYTDAYKIRVFSHKNNAVAEVIYHPSGPGIGWVNIRLIFLDFFNGYQVEAYL